MMGVVFLSVTGVASIANAQPSHPTGVTATDFIEEEIHLSWNTPSTGIPDSYYLYRSVDNVGCSGAHFATVSGSDTSFIDVSFPSAGVIYYYSLRSLTAGSLSPSCSNTAGGTAEKIPPPQPPLNFSATTTDFEKVQLAWIPPSSNSQPVVGYNIYRTTISGERYCLEQHLLVRLNGVMNYPYNDSTAVPGQTYYYSIRSIGQDSDNRDTFSSCPGESSKVGRRPAPPAPQAPGNISATDGTFTDKVLVTWLAPETGGTVTKYNIFRSTSAVTCSGTPLATVDVPLVSFDDFSAIPGIIYNYRVESEGPDGKACGDFDPGHARLLPPGAIDATDGLFPDRVNVTWNPPVSGANIGGYELFRTNDCSGSPIAVVLAGVHSYSDTNVTPGVIYDYSIKTYSTNPDVVKSACGPTDPGHASLSAPRNVSATDGTFPNKVDVSWNPPVSGSNFGSYRIYRNANCSCTEIATVPTNVFLYSDFSVTPGVIYDYSIQLFSSLHPVISPSPCVTDPGHASIGSPVNVSATDGDFPDRVQVSWTPNPANGNVGSYQIFRNASCSGSTIGSVNGSTITYPDFDVEPGVVYQYSVKAISSVSGVGAGACSLPDPGHASISPPPLEVSTSTTPQGLKPGWTKPPGNITGYELYRSDISGDRCVGSPIATPGAGVLMFVDESVEKGRVYYYSILATSPTGKSSCSNAVASILEGEALLSPAFAKFNTYLGQRNFAELINQGTKNKPVKISIFNLRGQLMTESTVVVPPNQQVDIDIHARIQFACDLLQSNCEGFEDLSATVGAPNGLGRPDGIVDTYGLVRFEFDDSDPLEKLVGRMSFYRPNTNGSFSFAFAREFRNPITGNGYGVSNTYDPRGMGFLVPNWSELISFGVRNASGDIDLQPLGYTVNIYDQDGVRKLNKHVVLQPLGEIDIHGGHEFVNSEGKVVEGVYLVEVIPDNPKAEYSLSIARYSSNAPPATDPETYNYAFVAEGSKGSMSPIYAPIGNTIDGVLGLSDKIFADNWVEIACISNQDCEGSIRFVSSTGKENAAQNFKIKSKSQFHFNASAILDPKSTGSVHIIPITGMIIGQSMTYLHGGENDLQSAFVSPAREPGFKVQSGSINTYLGMQNVLNAFSTVSTTTEASYEITSFSGGFFQGVLGLGGESVSSFRISDNSALNFPSNTYGAMILTSDNTINSLNAEVRRVRVLPDGKIDFVMPTLMK